MRLVQGERPRAEVLGLGRAIARWLRLAAARLYEDFRPRAPAACNGVCVAVAVRWQITLPRACVLSIGRSREELRVHRS